MKPFGASHAMKRRSALDSGHQMTQLAYELLDAHDDTARLAAERAGELRWRAHLDYLRDLQRVGRAMLAQSAAYESAHAELAAPLRLMPRLGRAPSRSGAR